MYTFIERCKICYTWLQDDLSRNIFWKRLQFDMEPTMGHAMELLALNPFLSSSDIQEALSWKKQLEDFSKSGKKLVVYGAGGIGKKAAETLLLEGVEFYGFCGRKGPEGYPNGQLLGKPVISPEYLVKYADEFCVAICAEAITDIKNFLKKNNFPQHQIMRCFDLCENSQQYFEFPSLYHGGTAFVDGGCLDAHDDAVFRTWCGNNYSYILAFEPDPQNYSVCIEKAKEHGIDRIDLVQAALSKQTGEVCFSSNYNGGSHILQDGITGIAAKTRNETKVKTYALDDFIDDRPIGFIKLDVEGAELDALKGSEKTIVRDKPFMALSVYHRNGDVLILMDYLHQLVPEYRFWLRHYGPLHYETVLYASPEQIGVK